MSPLVSVVIVTHGGGHLLPGCVAALRENTREALEVIVLDSASPDGTGEWAQHALRDVTVHTSDRNVGFGALCNAGVVQAKAPYVCFLNADVLVGPNWLPPLLDVLEAQPEVGAVAPLMLNEDGSVQEYGSIVGSDGWTRAWVGDELGGDEWLPFRRSVDYASGACLLVRRSALTKVGGFAQDYHIAYFEDVDLAFALREAGWSTVVEPRSTVVHERHGSAGSVRAKELMVHNHGAFAAKWADQLKDRVPVDDRNRKTHHLAHARDITVAERILVIDDRVPNADRGSGDPRTLTLLEALVAPDRLITYLARDGLRAKEYAPWLLDRGVEVVWNVDVNDWLALRKGTFDVVIVSRPVNWEWAAAAIDATQPQAMRVYDAEALFHRRLDQVAEASGNIYQRREADRIRAVEAEAFRWADIGVCITMQEVEWAATAAPGTHLRLIGYPAGVPDQVRDFDARSGVVFFGGFMSGPGSPNEHSALELVSDVWPGLRELHPDLRLSIVGADPTPAVLDLAGADIDVVGRVPHPAWWLGRALLHVAPMRFGAGMKLKFVESMAAGLPFITTPLGAEGLKLGEVTEYLVATSPAETVELADRLLSDRFLWSDVQRQLLEVVEEHFSVRSFTDSVNEMLLGCGIAPAVR